MDRYQVLIYEDGSSEGFLYLSPASHVSPPLSLLERLHPKSPTSIALGPVRHPLVQAKDKGVAALIAQVVRMLSFPFSGAIMRNQQRQLSGIRD